MSYQFASGRMYRMPTHFGPATGPRQGPTGNRFACIDNPKTTTIAVSFLTRAEQLTPLLPPGFALVGEPVVTVTASYITEIEWLAGRGYNTLGVTFPVSFTGAVDRVQGHLLTVLWENLTDPIITGREELGYAKIYCELPDPSVLPGATRCTASWLGFKFMDLVVNDLQPVRQDASITNHAAPTDGTLHYKYMPRTGVWGQADAEYAVLTPAANPNRVLKEQWRGSGQVTFHHARWEDLPTQYMIVNTFHALAILDYRDATITKTVGGKDLSDQRILA